MEINNFIARLPRYIQDLQVEAGKIEKRYQKLNRICPVITEEMKEMRVRHNKITDMLTEKIPDRKGFRDKRFAWETKAKYYGSRGLKNV